MSIFDSFMRRKGKIAGIDKYMFLATLDLRTCLICAKRDLRLCTEHSAPPCHPGCRCTVMPQIPRKTLAKTKRFARDPVTGEGMQVPGDMDYQSWYRKYVAGNMAALENKRMIKSGVSSYPYQETQILLAVGKQPGILQSALSEVSGVPKSTAMMILRRKVDEGMITKERAGRSFALYLNRSKVPDDFF